MTTLDLLNLLAWGSVFLAAVWATHSRYVHDGLVLKIALGSLAFGALANALRPTLQSQIWTGFSIAAIVMVVVFRLAYAKLTHQKPIFLVF